MVKTRWPTIWKPDPKSVWEMAIRMPDDPAFRCTILYSTVHITFWEPNTHTWERLFKSTQVVYRSRRRGLQKWPSSAAVEEWDEALPTRPFCSVFTLRLPLRSVASVPLRCSLRWIRTTYLPVENKRDRPSDYSVLDRSTISTGNQVDITPLLTSASFQSRVTCMLQEVRTMAIFVIRPGPNLCDVNNEWIPWGCS
jgi:hypothetical protein